MSVDLRNAPYHDDYSEDKDFLQILFKGGAVQIREMNQLQSILQNQISRLGNNLFEDGSLVVNGTVNFDLDYHFLTLTTTQTFESIKGQLVGSIVKGDTSLVEAEIVEVVEGDNTDPLTFYLKYLNANEEHTTFITNEPLTLTNNSVEISKGECINIGKGSKVNIEDGIYYINNRFVRVNKQSKILSKYSNNPSYRIGLTSTETIITPNEDETLYDNANGTTNYTAAGADRLKLVCELDTKPLEALGTETISDIDFIEIARIVDGVYQTNNKPDYAILEETLARRTYDESGDYVIDNFGIDIREHKNTGNNHGVYDQGDINKIAIGLESGKAYVRGFEIEKSITEFLSVDKARTTESINNSAMVCSFGAYIEVDNLYNVPDYSLFDQVSFYDNTSVSGAQPSGSLLGTARIRYIEHLSGTVGTTGAVYKVYLFEFKNTTGSYDTSFLTNAVSMYNSTMKFSAKLKSVDIKNINEYSLLYKLPYDTISTLLDGTGANDTSYTVNKVFNATTNGSGVVTLSASSQETFTPFSSREYLLAITDNGSEEIIDLTGKVVLSGTPLGKTLTIDLGVSYASKNVRVSTTILKQLSIQKTKTITNDSVTGTITNNKLKLNKADVFNIVSIIDDTTLEDITNNFELVTNNKPNLYDISYIQLKGNLPEPESTITVNFDYFSHSVGDYFSVDSYSAINYQDIPSEYVNGVLTRLSDVIDFRPRIDDTGNTFNGSGASIGLLPKSNTFFRADLKYFLPRTDKVYLKSNGEFGVSKGIPSTDPVEPNIPTDAIHLYTLNIPSYTFNVNDVEYIATVHKRYTMSDIAKLEQRLSNVEYYTALNSLEKETADKSIVDNTTGLDRFKNGFLVDSFLDHNIGDANNKDYKCAIDNNRKVLQSEIAIDAVDFTYNNTDSTNCVKTGDLISLPYTKVAHINNYFASTPVNINPYAIFRFIGSLNISPKSDHWFDNRYIAPIVRNNNSNVRVFNQTINAVDENWTGTRNLGESWQRVGRSSFSGNTRTWTEQLVERIAVSTVSRTNRIVGDRVVSQDTIPFMRSKVISFKAEGLRPNCQVHAFFDGVNVDNETKQNGKNYGQKLITNIEGELEGQFRIPNTQAKRFRTGTRKLMLVDSVTGNENDSTTLANAQYEANGIRNTRQRSIVSTLTVNTTIQTRNLGETRERVTTWVDPLAQSFLIEQDEGIVITDIDIAFQSKDPNIPVKLEIREMINGFPTQNVVPYGECTLKPSQVSVSQDSGALTTFTFETPVYLPKGEFCFVLMANSVQYNCWVAKMGERDLRTQRAITKQPYAGVLFKSQNNSTWSVVQNEDLKFVIKRAKFDHASTCNVVFNNQPIESVYLDKNSIVTNKNSSVVSIICKDHGLVENSKTFLNGCVGGLGINTTDLNKEHTVLNVIDNNIFTIDLGVNSTGTGTIGGDNIECGRNIPYNTFKLIFGDLKLSGTEISYSANTVTSKSIDGIETPYIHINQPISIENNENYHLPTPMMVLSEEDEVNIANDSSLDINATLVSNSEYVSPLIDTNRLGMILMGNVINNKNTNELNENGGDSISRYITQPSTLELPANALKMYIDVNRPQNSNTKVYYKVGNSSEELDDIKWVSLPTVKEPIVSDDNQYYESEYGIDNLSDFKVYQIKIVSLSTSSSRIPSYKKLRVIALGT